jgi:CubicO group peptidase (beta-lactamase class C family)
MSKGDDVSHLPETEERKSESLPTAQSLMQHFAQFGRLASPLTGLAISIGLVAAIAADPRPPQSGKHLEEIGTVRQIYDGALYPDIQVQTFRNIDRLFPTRTVKRGAHADTLPKSATPLKGVEFASAGKKYDIYDYMSLNRVSGLLVIKDGKIAFERYELGNKETTRWMSMSVVKSVSSTLVGVAIRDGYIKSLDDPITKYLPTLAGSAYEGSTVKTLLQMASGVEWDETYTNPASDRRHMLEAQLSGKPGSILEIMRSLPRAGEPGTIWNYNTGETQIVGELIHAAVKRPVAQYLSERIWSKVGMESDATWWLDSPNGQEIGGSGLSATLRDYGRFGLFFMNGAVVEGKKILPEGWISEAGSPKIIGGKKINYGYMWWIPDASANPVHEGALLARGTFGQFMYLNPAEKVVVVVWSARPKPTGSDTIKDEDFFAAVVKALH